MSRVHEHKFRVVVYPTKWIMPSGGFDERWVEIKCEEIRDQILRHIDEISDVYVEREDDENE